MGAPLIGYYYVCMYITHFWRRSLPVPRILLWKQSSGIIVMETKIAQWDPLNLGPNPVEEDDQKRRRPKWKTTKMEDDQNGRRPKWKTTKMEDNQNGRRPKWKTTKKEDDQNGRRPKWKTTKIEDDQNGR